MVQDIIEIEVLRSMLNGEEKQFHKIRDYVWERIKNLNLVTKNSFDSTILNRCLNDLIVRKIVRKNVIGHKNVFYSISDMEKAKAIVYSLDLKKAITELLQTGVSKDSLFMETRNFLTQVLLEPFWLKICESRLNGNKRDFAFYKEEGQRFSAFLFEAFAESFFSSRSEKYNVEAKMELAALAPIVGPAMSDQSNAAKSFFEKPHDQEAIVHWLHLKLKGMKQAKGTLERLQVTFENYQNAFTEDFLKRFSEEDLENILGKELWVGLSAESRSETKRIFEEGLRGLMQSTKSLRLERRRFTRRQG